MINWIDKNERLPTRSDADNQGYLIGLDSYGSRCYQWENIGTLPQCTHWIAMKDITQNVPIPKRWRIPTIHDLAKAGKPIPCRVFDANNQAYATKLFAIDVSENVLHKFMDAAGDWYRLCEICDE